MRKIFLLVAVLTATTDGTPRKCRGPLTRLAIDAVAGKRLIPVTADEASLHVRGFEGAPDFNVHVPAIRYHYPKNVSRKGLIAMAEAVLSKMYGKPITLDSSLTSPLQHGQHLVFRHPLDPTKVIKIFDPSALDITPDLATKMIQRDIAMEELLVKAGFRVARLDRTHPELFDFGITIQNFERGNVPFSTEVSPETAFGKRLAHYENELRRLRKTGAAYWPQINTADPASDLFFVREIDAKKSNLIRRKQGDEVTFVDW